MLYTYHYLHTNKEQCAFIHSKSIYWAYFVNYYLDTENTTLKKKYIRILLHWNLYWYMVYSKIRNKVLRLLFGMGYFLFFLWMLEKLFGFNTVRYVWIKEIFQCLSISIRYLHDNKSRTWYPLKIRYKQTSGLKIPSDKCSFYRALRIPVTETLSHQHFSSVFKIQYIVQYFG